MPDKQLQKIIFMCAFLTGAIIGIPSLFPKLTGAAFLFIMLMSAPFVLMYIVRLNPIKNIDMTQCLIIGGMTGFIAFIGFSFVYFPIAFILNLIFKIESFIWIKVIFTNIGFLIPMVILTALLCSLMNMFSSFITVYIYENLKQKNRGQNDI